MNPTLSVACFFLKSAWQAVSLRSALTALLLAPLAALHARDAPQQEPNVVFIFTDDQPQSAIGCMGHAHLATPHIDRLAQEGVLFEKLVCQDVDPLRQPGLDPYRPAYGAARHPQFRHAAESWAAHADVSHAAESCGIPHRISE